MPLDGSHVIHGADDDAFYVDDDTRRCATCNQIKNLMAFFYKPRYNEVHVDCRACCEERGKTKLLTKEIETDELLVKTLAKANARQALFDPSPKVADGLKAIAKSLGGQEKMYARMGSCIKRAMKSKNEDIGRKATMGMLQMMAIAEKQQNDSFDLSALTPEDRIDILMEPAKQLILTDAEFRQTLLNDPEVRRVLLGESGVEVLEAK